MSEAHKPHPTPRADVLAEEYRGKYLWAELDKARARIADLEEQYEELKKWSGTNESLLSQSVVEKQDLKEQLETLQKQADLNRRRADTNHRLREEMEAERDGLLEQLEAVREALVEFVGYDWHATQHIAGLQHDGHDLRAIHAEDIEALKRTRIKARSALAASFPASGATGLVDYGNTPGTTDHGRDQPVVPSPASEPEHWRAGLWRQRQ